MDRRAASRYQRGTVVRDLATGREGILMGYEIPRGTEHAQSRKVFAYIRPEGGGIEWETAPDMVCPIL